MYVCICYKGYSYLISHNLKGYLKSKIITWFDTQVITICLEFSILHQWKLDKKKNIAPRTINIIVLFFISSLTLQQKINTVESSLFVGDQRSWISWATRRFTSSTALFTILFRYPQNFWPICAPTSESWMAAQRQYQPPIPIHSTKLSLWHHLFSLLCAYGVQ
jgi:hypothetical protein